MTASPPTLVPTQAPARRLVFVVAMVAWVVTVFGAYYAVHKPVPAGLAHAGEVWSLLRYGWTPAAVVDASLNLLVAAWIGATALGVGSLLVQSILRGLAGRPLEHAAFSAGLGLGVLSLGVFALGALGLLAPLPAYVGLGLLSGIAAFGFKRWRRGAPSQARAAQERTGGGGYLGLLKMLLAPMVLLVLTQALTPPTAWDSLVYHLAGPRQYIQAGGIAGGMDIPHFYFPSLVEQLFTAGLLLKGDIAAQLLHLVLACVGALALYSFLARSQGPEAGWLGLGLLASATSLLSLATRAYVEWGLLTFGFLAFWALHQGLEQHNPRWLALSGCFAGLVLGVKYTGVFLVGALGLVLLWRAAHAKTGAYARHFPGWPELLLWGGLATTVASPWYIKNWLLTGNPVYPFFFGGWNWDTWKAEWFTRPGTGLVTEPVRLLAAPWELTILGKEGGAFYDVTLGPLFLALLPLLALRPRSTWASSAVVVVLVGYGAWLYGAAQSELLVQGRLLLPVLPFLAALLAGALAEARQLDLPFLRVQPFLQAGVALALGLNLLTLTLDWAADPPLPSLVGAESRSVYLERHLGDHYRAVAFLNSELSPQARVLFLWEPRSYLCHGECQPDALLYNWRYLLFRYQTPEGVQKALKAEGYTHLLLHGGGLRYFSESPHVEVEGPHIEALLQFETRYLERLYGPALAEILASPAEALGGKGYVVYRLRS